MGISTSEQTGGLVRNKMSSVFMIGHPDILYTDNGKEF